MSKAVLGHNSAVSRHRGFCKRHAILILVVIGLIFTIAGVVCAITGVFEDWVEREIKKGVVLKPGKEVYRKWRHPETPVYLSFYMFNVTNAREVSANGTPSLQQLGPYSYREIPEKIVLSRHSYTPSSITYVSKKAYVFDKEMSCETCDPMLDKITNINLPFLTTINMIVKFIQAKSPNALSFALKVLDETFQKVDLTAFQTLTVNELLWGHRCPALSKAHAILLAFAQSRDPSINMTLPESFALQQNNTATLYTLDSGEDNVDRVGQYLLWNQRQNISCWNSEYAVMINGTDSSRFLPFVSKDDILYVLETSVFRSLKFIYDSTVHVRNIRLYSFTLDPVQFVTGDINGNNKGFCVTGKENKCLPTGLMDLSRCHPLHAPIVISLPHFYLGDPKLLKTVKGLNPQKRIHGSFIAIEPYTGLAMQGNKRIQINVAVREIHGITAYENISRVYLPLMYIDEHGRITEDDADDFKHDVLLPLRLSRAAPFILLGIGVIFLFTAGCLSYCRHHSSMKRPKCSREELSPLLKHSTLSNQKNV